jgi:hypothetical protein
MWMENELQQTSKLMIESGGAKQLLKAARVSFRHGFLPPVEIVLSRSMYSGV